MADPAPPSQPEPEGRDRRCGVRYPFHSTLWCKPVDLASGPTWHGNCRDLSHRGVQIVTERRFEGGTVLLIDLDVGGEAAIRSVLARVMWCERNPAGGWCLGCALIDTIANDELESLLSEVGASAAAVQPVKRETVTLLPEPSENRRLQRVMIQTRGGDQSPPEPAHRAVHPGLVARLLERVRTRPVSLRLPSRHALRTAGHARRQQAAEPAAVTSFGPATVGERPAAPTKPSGPADTAARRARTTMVPGIVPTMPSLTARAVERARPPAEPGPPIVADPPKVERPTPDPATAELLARLTQQLDSNHLVHARETCLAVLERQPGDLETLAVLAYVHDGLDAPGQVGELRCFTGHGSHVNSVAFGPDGRYGFSGSGGETIDGVYSDGRDPSLRVWDLAAGKEIARFTQHSSPVLSVACACDASRVVTATRRGKLFSIDARDLSIYRVIGNHRRMVFGIAMFPDGKHVLSGCDDGMVRLWDLAGNRLKRMQGHKAAVTAVAPAPDGQWAASASLDRTVWIWDLETGKSVQCLEGHPRAVLSIAVAPDGEHLLTGSADGVVRLWSVETAAEVRTFAGHAGPVTSLAFTPGGSRALSSSSDGTLRLWDVAGGAELHKFTGHTGPVTSVAVSPAGRRALSGGADQTIRLWGLPD